MTWEGELHKIDNVRWEIGAGHRSGMRVPGQVFANPTLLEDIRDDNALDQVANVATLPGIVGKSYAMPDCHWGYGFPIGGVAAFDADEGVISPGGVGFDINCGVRLIRTDLTEDDVEPNIRPLVNLLFENVPSGVGSKAKVRLSTSDVEEIFRQGPRWAVDQGYGWEDDLKHIEDGGQLDGAHPEKVSSKAHERGAPQVGSLGGGNHFLEVQTVEEIFRPEVAEAFGLTDPSQVVVMVHTGSRGAGHQICQDYLDDMEASAREYGIDLVDKQLAANPIKSQEAQDYLAAMRCGIHYAWTNRQMITHWIRESFEEIFGMDAEDMGMELVYDIAHNIAKRETHTVDGSDRDVFVHRKGATRAFAPGHRDIPQDYRDVGQPVLIPGDMGSPSYILAGAEGAMEETFGSTCHGAGRKKSRTQARNEQHGRDVRRDLAEQGIIVKAASDKVAAEEAPHAYKDASQVVDVCEEAGLSKTVAKVRPLGVVKG
jgi:tRNA-splicing ligase RtcB